MPLHLKFECSERINRCSLCLEGIFTYLYVNFHIYIYQSIYTFIYLYVMINLKIYHLHNYNVATYVIIKCILNVTRISLNIIVSHYSNIERCICENMTIIFIYVQVLRLKILLLMIKKTVEVNHIRTLMIMMMRQ